MDRPMPHEQGRTTDSALEELSHNLARDIFDKAESATAGDKFQMKESSLIGRVHGSALDEIFVGTADVEVSKKGQPEPIKLGSDPVVVTPAFDKGAFSELVLKPILEREKNGQQSSPNTIDIKLALPDGEELQGKLKLSFDDIFSKD